MTQTYSTDDILLSRFWRLLASHLRRSQTILQHVLYWSNRCFGPRHDFARFYAEHAFKLKAGKYSYGFAQFCVKNSPLRQIGAFCSFGPRVHIAEGNHPLHTISSHPFFYAKTFGFVDTGLPLNHIDSRNKGVSIGHDVWIGCDATILNGVCLGTGSVVAAGAVVTQDVPPYAIVGGVPARLIRYRFDKATIARLLASEWWLWPDARIKQHIALFHDTEAFLNATH